MGNTAHMCACFRRLSLGADEISTICVTSKGTPTIMSPKKNNFPDDETHFPFFYRSSTSLTAGLVWLLFANSI